MNTTNEGRWECLGHQFFCTYDALAKDEGGFQYTHRVEVIGKGFIGDAVSLMDAHSLSLSWARARA